MVIRVCSGWSPEGRELYGARFLASFDRFWPKGIELQVYVEEPERMPRGACRNLWLIPGARDFYIRHRNNPEVAGRLPRPAWKASARAAGYNFRFDALKFFKQILIPQAAADGLADGDVLIWLDGDVVTTAEITEGLILGLMGNADIAYLGRERTHSEIGFWAVRIGEATRQFLCNIAEHYTSDAFLERKEWHSAYIWDFSRRMAGLSEHNLTPGKKGHVFPKSPLGGYLRHDKGRRKPGGSRG